MDAAETIHENFRAALRSGDLPARRSRLGLADAGITAPALVDLFHSQVVSRQLDRISRKLQARGEGFYTIGSSGHEGNAALAAALRPGDMAFLHYRDAAFQIHRSKQVPGQTPVWDMLLSFAASAEDPISGGRHKVLGSKALAIPPQTSTIASHLPKAVGAAFSIGIAARIGLEDRPLAPDSIVLCSFGDASANHSTAQGAINTAGWAAYQGIPMPIIFACEDNGIGISTRTPSGWIAASFRSRPALAYLACDGLDLLDTLRTARAAAAIARERRKPVFLHMGCTRLYGHAGSDVQSTYLSRTEIAESDARDPLLHGAALLADLGILRPDQILDIYEETEETIARAAEEAIRRPKLTTPAQVMASLLPPRRAVAVTNLPSPEQRAETFGGDAAQMDKPQHMARLLSWALADAMLQWPQIVVAGEDVGPKGGVYNVTAKLHQRFGPARVINTLLDEQSILGLGIGFAHNDLLAITEIQFLAYVHNAEDQLRGEAATLPFFSNGQYANPMIVRIAGLGYQKGFGGHFHNDNSLAVFRDIPGIVLACPSNGRDAVAMLRECVRLAIEERRVVVFVEPIALYMTRDLHAEGDGLWTSVYEAPGRDTPIRIGEVGRHGDGTDLAIVSYANGYYLSRQAQKLLADEYGIDARVIDLRWLAPLDPDAILRAVGDARRVLIVDECRITGSQSEALMAMFAEKAPGLPVSRIAAEDSFIPLARAATLTLPSRDSILAAALEAVRD
ncbi:MFS transporter [Sphingomonas sp. C8-2]|jgi:2-oxoisovalerate dehydrogenase E1 component|uniref:2-oxoglutarate dehydrogenase E1 component n=1 Tax=Rhizorhabdus histidinilytica TaxID=439228 RepID=A0A1T5AZA1_9SPHN|nr:thiamine pyrophosphate-dependent enzyme [Rhizorhabdus histidinilytica]QEH79511.1 MFS transporter [Sphingomonas sp. C8-2]SKB40381.1 branched-chain alpha-keto acid dehydrogenase E1 component [Rhizorhabdus histidinilytica]